MRRYLHLYACFLRFSFSRAMEFRVDFFFRIGMDNVFYAVNLTFFWILYQHSQLLGGWTFDQTLIFTAGVFVADAVHQTLFSKNAAWFPIFVNRGDLDYYLVRPVSSLFMLSLRVFAANSLVSLIVAASILLWAFQRYPEPILVERLLLYGLLMAIGMFLNYVTQWLFLVSVFWMQSGTGPRAIWFVLQRYSARPDAIYSGWLRRILTSVLPFAIIVSFPTRVLFGGDMGALFVHMVLVAIIAFGVLLLLWRFGLRAYVSASS